MPETSTAIELGDHALELSEHSVLIVGHSGPSDPIAELVSLSDDEAYKLYTSLHARFQAREALLKYKQAWREYCALDAVQHPWVDRMHCTGCGQEHLVAHLSDSGRCDACRRLAVIQR